MFYKEIAGAEDTGMLQEIRGNLRDRYGNFLDVVDNLLGIALMKLICGQLGITHVSLYREGILMPKNSLTFRIGLPKLFPAGRLQAAAKELNIEIKLNARINVFFVTLPNVSPAQVLKKSLSLVKHLLHGE